MPPWKPLAYMCVFPSSHWTFACAYLLCILIIAESAWTCTCFLTDNFQLSSKVIYCGVFNLESDAMTSFGAQIENDPVRSRHVSRRARPAVSQPSPLWSPDLAVLVQFLSNKPLGLNHSLPCQLRDKRQEDRAQVSLSEMGVIFFWPKY